MTEGVEPLKAQASVLSAPERAELADFLLTSLEPEVDLPHHRWECILKAIHKEKYPCHSATISVRR